MSFAIDQEDQELWGRSDRWGTDKSRLIYCKLCPDGKHFKNSRKLKDRHIAHGSHQDRVIASRRLTTTNHATSSGHSSSAPDEPYFHDQDWEMPMPSPQSSSRERSRSSTFALGEQQGNAQQMPCQEDAGTQGRSNNSPSSTSDVGYLVTDRQKTENSEQALVAVAVKDQPRNRLSNEQVTSLAMDDGNYLVPNDTPGPSATAIQYPSAMLTNSTSQPSTGSSQSQTQTPHRTTPPGNQSQDQTRFADNITTNNRNLSTSSNRGEEGATTSDLHDLERRLTNNINNMLEDNLLAQLGEIASASDISNLKNYTQDALEGLSQGMSNVQETLTDVLKLLKELKQNNSSSSSSTKKPLESLSLTENRALDVLIARTVVNNRLRMSDNAYLSEIVIESADNDDCLSGSASWKKLVENDEKALVSAIGTRVAYVKTDINGMIKNLVKAGSSVETTAKQLKNGKRGKLLLWITQNELNFSIAELHYSFTQGLILALRRVAFFEAQWIRQGQAPGDKQKLIRAYGLIVPKILPVARSPFWAFYNFALHQVICIRHTGHHEFQEMCKHWAITDGMDDGGKTDHPMPENLQSLVRQSFAATHVRDGNRDTNTNALDSDDSDESQDEQVNAQGRAREEAAREQIRRDWNFFADQFADQDDQGQDQDQDSGQAQYHHQGHDQEQAGESPGEQEEQEEEEQDADQDEMVEYGQGAAKKRKGEEGKVVRARSGAETARVKRSGKGKEPLGATKRGDLASLRREIYNSLGSYQY